ncbi:FecR domain-containing protein [Pedobacter sp.]|uniref:FecR family protein n=1 Tax=Pedobacter sp. TaxID=1411316 RepID=UPI0031E07FC1
MHLNKEMEYNDEYIKALLVEKLAGTISEEDELVVNKALSDSPAARAYWQHILGQFQASSRASDFLDRLDEQQAWNRISKELKDDQHAIEGKKVPMWRYVVSTAAILAIAFVGFWMFRGHNTVTLQAPHHQVYLKTDDGQTLDLSADRKFEIAGTEINNQSKELSYTSDASKSLQWATLVVPPTKDYKIKLNDGTTVWLNATSSLRFPFRFDLSKREVYLKGEAYFEVAKNAKVPFIVHTDYAAIQVHGTSFNISAYENEVFTASLVEGAISAVKDQENILLKPGEEVFAQSGTLGVRNFDADLLSWRKGSYYFHHKPLGEIAQVLVRWYDVKIDWKSTAISKQIFTGEIDKSQSLEVVLSNLQLTSGIHSKLEKGILTFY